MPTVKKEVGFRMSFGQRGQVDGCVFSVEVGDFGIKDLLIWMGLDLMKTAILWYVCLQVFFFSTFDTQIVAMILMLPRKEVFSVPKNAIAVQIASERLAGRGFT